jgi:ribosomal protein S18 acetylase RimI-like enzyme
MTAYRFCRTDDMALLADALNRCSSGDVPGELPVTPAALKRWVRDLQVWCSSCMVALSGSEPIGVLIGAKRPSATLVYRIAVHPDHRRQGHGRHLLASLASKLAILGPPRLVAEVPETLASARSLFRASGYAEEALLTDYVSADDGGGRLEMGGMRGLRDGRFVIPVTIDDLAANGLPAESHPQACWERSAETLTARKDEIAGVAVASDERIEAYVLYAPARTDRAERTEPPPAAAPPDRVGLRQDLVGPAVARPGEASPRPRHGHAAAVAEAMPPAGAPAADIVALRSLVADGGARLGLLLDWVRRRGPRTLRIPKVHPEEISKERLEALGFRPAGGHIRCAAMARSD